MSSSRQKPKTSLFYFSCVCSLSFPRKWKCNSRLTRSNWKYTLPRTNEVIWQIMDTSTCTNCILIILFQLQRQTKSAACLWRQFKPPRRASLVMGKPFVIQCNSPRISTVPDPIFKTLQSIIITLGNWSCYDSSRNSLNAEIHSSSFANASFPRTIDTFFLEPGSLIGKIQQFSSIAQYNLWTRHYCGIRGGENAKSNNARFSIVFFLEEKEKKKTDTCSCIYS